MARSSKSLSADDLGILFFIAALIFGAWFRLYIPYTADFPINDGGLFHAMIEGIRAADFRLPEHVRYNGLQIPFVYPPLAFYLAAVVAKAFGTPLPEILSWMPAMVLVAIIPAIYILGRIILGSQLQAGLAALLYAVLPAAITWTIMGGGITRSLGQLFHVLAVANLFMLFTHTRQRNLILAVLFSSLVSLTHPEAALHTAGIALLLLIFLARNRAGVLNALLVGGGTLLVTSPWWTTVLLHFGLAPFVSTAQTGLHGLSHAIALFVPFSGEPFLTIIALLAVFGVGTELARGRYLLTAWFILPFLVEPRGAVNVAIFPMVLLASIALTHLILPALARIESAARGVSLERVLQGRAEKILFIYLLGSLLIAMQFYALNHAGNRLSADARRSLEWIRLNTPAQSRFIILTGKSDVFADFTNEWFPILAKRVSATTVQGLEWIAGGGFAERIAVVQELQQCHAKTAPLDCIERAALDGGLAYDHILISGGSGGANWGASITAQLEDSASYDLIHRSDDILIFRLKE